ncbi:MAG: elongation factor Tu [Euryarchaeota archaeon]|nr:elongation factor Tu [Euryarchaeota archaeon]
MKSLNYALLGDASIAPELGKKATQTDIATYDRKTGDSILTYAVATGYPEKLQPLVQMLALCDPVILNVSVLDRALGEQVVAAHLHGRSRGFLLQAPGVDPGRVAAVLKSTTLEGLRSLPGLRELREQVASLEQSAPGGETRVHVDQCFEVKGVGTVVLGVVARGTLRKHDDLHLYPRGTPVQVRSIQMHDDDVEMAPAGARVGLALKGTTAADVARGDQLAPEGTLQSAGELRLRFQPTPYYKSPIRAESQYHLQVGAQIHPVRAQPEGETLTAVSEHPYAYTPGDRALLLDLNSPGLRIAGGGTVL